DVEEAVLVELTDVARTEPAVRCEDRRRRLRVLEVALEDRLGAHLDLPVRGDPDLGPGKGATHRAEAVVVGRVGAARGRALGEPVPLGDADADRVEELDDLLRERGSAGPGHAQTATERLPPPARNKGARHTPAS